MSLPGFRALSGLATPCVCRTSVRWRLESRPLPDCMCCGGVCCGVREGGNTKRASWHRKRSQGRRLLVGVRGKDAKRLSDVREKWRCHGRRFGYGGECREVSTVLVPDSVSLIGASKRRARQMDARARKLCKNSWRNTDMSLLRGSRGPGNLKFESDFPVICCQFRACRARYIYVQG